MRRHPPRGNRARFPRSLREAADLLIASCSLVSNDPVLDVRHFPWTQQLRDRWQSIRDEAATGRSHGRSLMDRPRTQAVLSAVPGIESASLYVVAPGGHGPGLRGRSKGLITCHLGLVVPRTGDVRMRIKDRVVRWAEGETLVFDETHGYEIWNDTDSDCILLVVRFARPLRHPGKWIAERLLRFSHVGTA